MKQDGLSVKGAGHVSTNRLRCNRGNDKGKEGFKELEGLEEKQQKRRQGRNQYFCNVATPATSNDGKHHEKIWGAGKGKEMKEIRREQ